MAMVLYERCLFLWLRAESIFKISSTARLQEKSLNILHGYTDKVIQIRKRKLKENTTQAIHDQELNAKQKMAFLDTLLESAQELGFTDEEIRQEVDTIMFAVCRQLCYHCHGYTKKLSQLFCIFFFRVTILFHQLLVLFSMHWQNINKFKQVYLRKIKNYKQLRKFNFAIGKSIRGVGENISKI